MNKPTRPYQPHWESLDTRPTPAWFPAARFGIFIHWGVYSVPAWGPKRHTVETSGQAYAEWYWSAMQDREGPYWKFHAATYGEDFQYQDFAPQFRAEMFDPGQWADLFARAGARYVVLTSKHHDGFCLLPSPVSWNWNSIDIGAHRDLLGELTTAVRDRGLRMNFYYSLLEWFNPVIQQDVDRYVDRIMLPQLRDLVHRYQPSGLFTDGEWTHPSTTWRSEEFLAWLFNESPVRDEVVVNDRWGSETRSCHGGYFTTEYGEVGGDKELAAGRLWEENRAIGASFGYNRNEEIGDYLTEKEVIHLLIRTASRGGNLCLNVGPTADGRIPVIMQERLLQLGRWLDTNGEAIYDTQAGPFAEQPWGCATAGENCLYLHLLDWPTSRSLQIPTGECSIEKVYLLADPARTPLTCSTTAAGTTVELPPCPPDPVASVVVAELSTN